MKKLAIIAGAMLISGAAFADDPIDTSGLGANPNAKSQGSCVGVFSSQVTHNGTVVRQQAQSDKGRAAYVEEAHNADCGNTKMPN